MAELMRFRDTVLTDRELLLMDQQRRSFLEMTSSPGEDAMSVAEMTVMRLEYNMNLVDKSSTEFQGIDSNFEKRAVSTML